MTVPLLISGADARYFRSLEQFALSVARTQPEGSLRCVAVDLGLLPGQRASFARRFPHWELRRFEFERHPAHLRIRERALNSNAWKPVILREALRHADAPVLWFDSATVLLAPLDPLFSELRRTGLYTPFGGASSLAALTHPATLAALAVPGWAMAERQRASGVFGADPASPAARELVEAWASACLEEPIIVPEGARHAGHRFDQSVLNALLYPLAARSGIALTADEIDVSSPQPSLLYRTRNKVHPWIPLAADPLVRAWYAAYRLADVAWLRIRRPSRARSVNGER